MAKIQHQDAKKLLGIISAAKIKGEALTYTGVAMRMGRPADHSRAMCQGRSKTRPVRRSKSRPVGGWEVVGYSGSVSSGA